MAVIKTCREAFENPENLDEFLMMDKLADLLARVENTKVCMSIWGVFLTVDWVWLGM